MCKDIYCYKSTVVATYIVALANERRYGINLTKVIKLLYIVYGSYLAINSKRLIDESPEAWPYGPVFPEVRNFLKEKNLSSIDKKDPLIQESGIINDRDLNNLLNVVLDTFGELNSRKLINFSVQDDTPWSEIVYEPRFKWGKNIPDEKTSEYFNNIVQVDG